MRDIAHSDKVKITNWLNRFGAIYPPQTLETQEARDRVQVIFESIVEIVNGNAETNANTNRQLDPRRD